MDDFTLRILKNIGQSYGTPCYVYFLDPALERFDLLQRAFGGRFGASFAVKSNPNAAWLEHIKCKVISLDVSSIGEAERVLRVGYAPGALTFSGPAKQARDLQRAVEIGVGEIVCESAWELGILNAIAAKAGSRTSILLRINPKRMPRKFGVNMGGKPSQFGIDEEDLDGVLSRLRDWQQLDFQGFHIYSGTNSLSEPAIAENFGIFIELFERFSVRYGLAPRKLIFGTGFGIPYLADERTLDINQLADLINPQIDAMKREPLLAGAQCVLELGRWIIGPHGYLLTSVVNEKHSRGTEIRICDAGFNNHLSACGMMGSVIRRNWRFWKVTLSGTELVHRYLLVGPLCTSIDVLASDIELPELHRGDVLAIGASGAYGLTASPVGFISHPEPREYLVVGSTELQILDVTGTGKSNASQEDRRLAQCAASDGAYESKRDEHRYA